MVVKLKALAKVSAFFLFPMVIKPDGDGEDDGGQTKNSGEYHGEHGSAHPVAQGHG